MTDPHLTPEEMEELKILLIIAKMKQNHKLLYPKLHLTK